MDAIKLRAATLADATALGALHVASWQETYTGIIPDEMLGAISVESRIVMWREILGEPDAFGRAAVFVAEDGGLIVGFGSCAAQRDKALADAGFGGEIGAIYIFRSHQNRGVGRAIMAALSESLSASGYAAASLWVLHENTPARAFYERMGGKIIGERSDRRPTATLVEVAYGWRDLSCLTGARDRSYPPSSSRT